MPKTYSESETLKRIATGLIPNHHPELVNARIKYLFVDKGASKGGRELYGKAQKLSGVSEFLVEADFLLVMAEDKWRDLNADQQTAVVDHFLECCTGEEGEDGSMAWKIREPDTQEFSSILSRHGAWHEGLVAFVEVAKAIDVETIAAEEGEVNLADSVVTESLN